MKSWDLRYNPYEIETQNVQTFPQLAEELEPTQQIDLKEQIYC